MSIDTAKFIDTFSNTQSQGWGQTDTGQVWTMTGFPVTIPNTNPPLPGTAEEYGIGRIRNFANTGLATARIMLPQDGVPTQTRDSVLMKVRVTSPAQWPLTDFGPILSYSGTNTFYYFTLQGNWGEVAIGVYINGYRYEIRRRSYAFTKNTYHWVRFERHASGLRAKIWKENEPEPSGWFMSTGLWDGSRPPAGGSPGLFKKGTRDSHDIEVSEFYYTPSTVAQETGLSSDTFARTVTEGWGVSSSGHKWQGTNAVDPNLYRVSETHRGYVEVGNGGRGVFPQPNQQETSSFLGPIVTGDIENLSTFMIGTGQNVGTNIRIGLRGRIHKTNGTVKASGYMVQVKEGSNSATMYYRTAPTDEWIALASGNVGTTVSANTIYNARFQIVGTTLNFRLWANGSSEPSTWQITATNGSITSGRLWIGGYQGGSATRPAYLYNIEHTAPTRPPEVVKNFTTTGEITMTVEERGAAFTAKIEDDANNNGTVTVRYKPATATAWINHTGGIAASGKNRNFGLSGLLPNTTYNVQVTWQDPDGVVGSNPKQVTFTTTSKSIQPLAIKINSVSTTSVEVQATYERDSDNDSTATVAYRTTNAAQKLVEDYFVDEDDEELLQNISSTRGGRWWKHPSSTLTVQGVVASRRIYADTISASDKVLYYQDAVASSEEYDVIAEFFAASLNGTTGVAARVHPELETYYGAGVNAREQTWELFKVVGGLKTVLESVQFEHNIGMVHELKFIVRNAYKSVELNGEELFRTTDNEITDAGHAGYYSSDIVQGSTDNQFLLDTVIQSIRSTPGSWSSEMAMTPNRATKTFTANITNLDPDTIYEFRVTFSDTDGSTGSNVLLITAQTTGTAAGLERILASPSATSAIVEVFYEYDANNNAYVEFQYKSVMDDIWITVPFMNAHADRTMKKFSFTLTALQPSQTYAVRAYIEDSDGILEGSPTMISGLFTTRGFVVQDQRQTKHYVWKVYKPVYNAKTKKTTDTYVGTIADAPEPEFSLHTNGGVTDLSFELPRKMSDLRSEGIIDFQNRIDIWAIDPSSDGMGPNLCPDPDCRTDVEAWTQVVNGVASRVDAVEGVGPDGSSALRIVASNDTNIEYWSGTIDVIEEVPLVISCIGRATGAKLRMFARAYDPNDTLIETSDEIVDTIGTDWQTLKINFLPPPNTAYIRVVVENTGRGTMFADKFQVLAKEILVYRGKIESYTPEITENGESVQVEVLGLASLLSDDYIEFLQFVETQPQKDVEAGRINYGAKDPADMMKMVIDMAKKQNPQFSLYYTTDSIQYTGNLMQYTFRDQQIRNCMDKIRTLCPAGWHYFIEADGKVWLRSQESATTHLLRIGVEILRFSVERSIRNLKNYVRVKGRQDEDMTEVDGHGSINHIAFDQKSIDKYGKRTVFIRDAQLTDPESAKIVAEGRLEEYNREEQRVECYIPDNKVFTELTGSLRGYNIESFRPGDTIVIVDPVAGGRMSFWDKFRWDIDAWDESGAFMPLPEPVPIVTIQNHGSYAQLQLSERPPSQVGDFSRLYRWMANKERE